MSKQISRRDFMRWSAIAAAGGVVAACAPKAAPTQAPAPVAQPSETAVEAAAAKPTATTAAAAVPPTSTPMPTVAKAKYNEAPALAELVKAGKLPPVEERLPKNPTILETEAIGQYGGLLYQASLGVNQYFDMAHINEVYMFVPNNAGTALQPDAAESFEISPDAKEITLKLREGMKWSDGEPFTTDDIMYRWTDEIGVKGLEHWSDNLWKVAGKDPVFTKVDDFTLKISLPSPFRPAVGMLGNWTALQTCFYDPAHFLKKFHIKYNPDAEKEAKAAGFEFWYQAYAKHRTAILDRSEPGDPTLCPIIIKETDTTHVKWERNPYYFAVDKEGNQLPYTDGMYMYVVENMEMVKAKAMSGELTSFGAWMSQLVDMPAYKENEKKGDYTTREWIMPTPGALMVAFNLTHKDPVLRKIFNDIRWRQAMSVAINRQEIIDKLFFGKAEPTQATVERHCSFFKPEWEKAFAQFDMDKANQLLDEMELKWDAGKKFRMRPDGKPLQVVISHQPEFSPSTLELVKSYWDAVGVQTDVKQIQRDLYNTKGAANDLDVGVWNADRMIELGVYQPGATKFEPNSEMHYAEPWAVWRTTGGDASKLAEGQPKPEEPPQIWKDQFALMDKWYTCATDDEYKKLGQQVWQFFSDQLVLIGLYGYPVQPQVIKNGLMNCPQKANLDDRLNWFKSLHPEQFWWKKA